MSMARWSNKEGTRQGGAPTPPGRALHPRGPLVAPLTDFFRLYISIYPKTVGEQNRSGVPLPQASVATKNQSGPCSGTLPEEGSLTGVHLHHPALSMTRREYFTLRAEGMRVCTSSYVFDLSFSLMFSLWHDLDVSRALLL